MQNIVLINNSRAAWPIQIPMHFSLSFSKIFLQDADTIKKCDDNFEIVACSILVEGYNSL